MNQQDEVKREECNCQATLHILVNNCLACGKIVCSKEGPGPCFFCGAMVEKGDGSQVTLENNTNSVIIDEQSDYYNLDDAWLTPEEKKELREREDKLKKRGRRKKV